jgi:methionyl-tRNA formyltransferase
LSLRAVFMGTPELACASLEAVLNAPDIQVLAVVTQPDRPKGRALHLTPSPVKELASGKGLPVLQPEKAREKDFIDSVRQMNPELILVAAYGQILPATLLEVPRLGCLNVHTSLLPKLRGAAPIQWAILNDEPVTGITIMKMDAGLDTGDILARESTAILPTDDAQSLHDRLAQLGGRLLVETIGPYASGTLQPTPQPTEGATYARKILKEDGRIDWNRPARTIWNQVRGLVPWPGAFTYLTDTKKSLLKIWKAEVASGTAAPGQILAADKSGIVVGCGHHALRILSLQREGARRLAAAEFLAGWPFEPGDRFLSAT